MRQIYILLLFLLSLGCCQAQTTKSEEDAQAYDLYLSQTFAENYSLQLLQSVYCYLNTFDGDSVKDKRYSFVREEGIVWKDLAADITKEGPIVIATPTRLVGTQNGFSEAFRHYEDKAFPDSLKNIIKLCHQTFREEYPQIKHFKKQLTSQIKSFDSMAKSKPLFFADIYKDYNNDIAAYVNALCKESVLINENKYQQFLRKPTAEKIIDDLGVQFIIDVSLYKLWLNQ